MIDILLQEIYCSLSDFVSDFLWDQALYFLHEGRSCEATFWGPLWSTIAKSLCNGFGGDGFFEVVTEFAEEFMIQANGPVFAKEFSDIRNQASVISLGDFIEVFET